MPLADWLAVETRYSYSNYSSNLPSADYAQSIVDVSLVSEF